MSRILNLSVLAAAWICCLPAQAQIPDEFTNLQLLDPEISQGELISLMRGFSRDLGVRCTHCHGGRDDLVGTDFASDALATKRTARAMIKMVRAIQLGHLAALPVAVETAGHVPSGVTCYTCHRGVRTPPRPTADLLEERVATEGAEAAVRTFTELRANYSEGGLYDLRPVVLFRVARQAMESGQNEAALVLLDALHGLAPAMGDAYALRAQVEIARGSLEAAEVALEKAREVEPDARLADWVAQLLTKAREK